MRKILYRKLINFTDYSDFIYTGWFHRFQFILNSCRALIETEDGDILSVNRDDIKFVNTPEDEMWEQRSYEIAKELSVNMSADKAVMHAEELIEILKE